MRYVENSPKTWSAICIAVYVAGMAYMGLDTIPDEFGLWLGMCALSLLLLLPLPRRSVLEIRLSPNPDRRDDPSCRP
ncbi:hypothetical protein [Streptomyces sp. AC627_RSS907]|uniref:hypothetical protein n=1 Tax=Streptomyces sp. AC627_RSS907 TaxID=2823684 RepID=UPI0020B80A6E|nr:hypothetical protein [Streptomyces sp. AC627_RSS907]